MFRFDSNETAWLNQYRALARLVAIASALLFAAYAAVDWFLAPELLARTLPWRLMGIAPCLATAFVLSKEKLRRWEPLFITSSVVAITVVVSIIFLGILRDMHIAIAAQMQVLMTIAVFATLRTVVRALLPAMLISFNVGLWWINAPWQLFALANCLMASAFFIVLVVSKSAYATFQTIRMLESEQQLQANIVQNSDDAIIGRRLDGIVTSWNTGAQRLFGYSAAEMIGQPLQGLVPPERSAEDQAVLPQILRGDPVKHFETVRVCKDGTRKDVSVSFSPLRDTNGKVIGASKIARDITEHKRIARAMQDKDAMFRVAVETTTDGFWATDISGNLLDANQAYERLSGYTRKELLAMCIGDLEALEAPVDTATRIAEIMRDGSATFETTHRRKDGSIWPVEVITSFSNINGGQFFVFCTDLTERKKSEELTWRQANFDSLTNLPNRALLFDRLSKECALAKRNNTSMALLFADLDGFKLVNDNFGHEAGDLVLKKVAQRWSDCVRDADTVARLGGDEFAIVLGGLQDAQAIVGMAEKLIVALLPEMQLPQGVTCRVGVSIGICIFPTDATEVDDLISMADAAMYESKRKGKNTYTFCSSGLSQPKG